MMWRRIVKLRFYLVLFIRYFTYLFTVNLYVYRLSIKECRIGDGSGIRHHKKCLVWEISDKNVKTMTI
jgi:hypothetical protein